MYSLDDIRKAVLAEQPAGKDLSITGELLELESLAKPLLPTNAEGKRIADDFSEREPDWEKIGTRCEELLKITRDLRVAVVYAASLLRIHGFSGLLHGLEIVRLMLTASEYRAFPQFEAGDRSVLLERWYTLVALGTPYKQEGDQLRIIEGIRSVSLVKSKAPSCRYLEVVAARNKAGGVDAATVDRLRAEWKKIPIEERAASSASLTAVLGSLAEIEAVLLEQTPEDLVPPGASSRPLQGVALEIKGLLEFINGSVPQRPAAASVGTVDIQTGMPGEIRSRADAIRTLQQVAGFFRKTEPASPIPYFVERAIRLVDRDFMGLLDDLVPDAVPRFQALAGVEGRTTAQG